MNKFKDENTVKAEPPPIDFIYLKMDIARLMGSTFDVGTAERIFQWVISNEQS